MKQYGTDNSNNNNNNNNAILTLAAITNLQHSLAMNIFNKIYKFNNLIKLNNTSSMFQAFSSTRRNVDETSHKLIRNFPNHRVVFTCSAWRAASAASRDENVTKPTG